MVMFIPITVFLTIYYLFLTGKIVALELGDTLVQGILLIFPLLSILTLTIVHLVTAKKFKVLTAEPSLGIRLEKYFSIAFLRIVGLVQASLLMAIGLFLTGSEYFTIYFSALLIWLFFIWPTPKRVCKDLKLKGDESKMVLTKGEAFK
jgi:hypothetical protein